MDSKYSKINVHVHGNSIYSCAHVYLNLLSSTFTVNGENWLLVTNELVEFEKSPVEIQDFMIITD